jgi:hypothetical protein
MNCSHCTDLAVSRGMCRVHYGRWYRTGDPLGVGQGHRKTASIEDRVASSFVELTNGCWEWRLGINAYGYGKIKYQGRTLGAHAVSYKLKHGWDAIEESFELDHLCHTLDKACVGGVTCRHRRCINPDHLEIVSKVENTLRRDLRKS